MHCKKVLRGKLGVISNTKDGWTRKMLVSTLTLFGLDEIMAAHASYTELAEIIRRRFTDPKDTLRELFSRMLSLIHI